VRRSAKQLRALLEREEKNGVPADRIILAGFSQGGRWRSTWERATRARFVGSWS